MNKNSPKLKLEAATVQLLETRAAPSTCYVRSAGCRLDPAAKVTAVAFF